MNAAEMFGHVRTLVDVYCVRPSKPVRPLEQDSLKKKSIENLLQFCCTEFVATKFMDIDGLNRAGAALN